jgi:uncharacterized phage-associated protein
VTEPIRENDGTAAAIFGGERGGVVSAILDENESRLLDAVWDAYKKYSAFQLSEMTHQLNSPWTVTTEQSGPFSVISNNVIKEHFQALIRQRQAATA